MRSTRWQANLRYERAFGEPKPRRSRPCENSCQELAYRARVEIMDKELSPQTEEYLASVVAGGLFPSKEVALEAAVDALREKTESIPFVPDEHMERVEQAIESANAGSDNSDDTSRLGQTPSTRP